MTELQHKTCTPCSEGAEPLKGEDVRSRLAQLDGWEAVEEHHLRKEFSFEDFASALSFVNRVGDLAEQQGHHPWIHFTYGKVIVEIYTHKIDGLHENDFILAAKIDELPRS
ncbi:MAG: 4a-hydroxytetrahydrobiopterin dehydratase [Phycisphaerae bacterium]